MLTYSVVVCTLDRPEDLKTCIRSWLDQEPRPAEVIIVHGRPQGLLQDSLPRMIEDAGVKLIYIRMAPSLVHQRNAGMRAAAGDVVFFADDDAEYFPGYAKAILEVYEHDTEGTVGGVQGTIQNWPRSLMERAKLAKFFQLTHQGDGRLQRSAWPAFYGLGQEIAPVEVFSGPAMSFRRKVLDEFQFDEALERYWMGDDFEMAHRVSRSYRLYQVAAARLNHYVSPLGRDGARRLAKMNVVNHWYLMRKLFGPNWSSRLHWAWSELGLWIAATYSLLSGNGVGRLLGMIDGYLELLAKPTEIRTSRSA
jgi:glycosyltransferase involved in cell wall biosynthesis